MRWLHGTIVALICVFLIAPATIVIPLSFAGDAMTRFPPQQFSFAAYAAYFRGPGWVDATQFSLLMASTVMVIAVAIGAATAYGVHSRSPRTTTLLMVFVLMPIVMPPIIFAIGIYPLLANLGILGTFVGFVVANIVLAVPYAVVTIRAGLQELDWSLLRAAAVLGAGPLRVTRRIAVPLLMPSVASAALFTFLAAFDEVVVAQFISGPFAVPLPKRMWDGILYRWDPAISAISTIQILLTVAVLLAIAVLRRGRIKDQAPTADQRPAGE
jgi:putative spermidine/putrescine transport system permease protein